MSGFDSKILFSADEISVAAYEETEGLYSDSYFDLGAMEVVGDELSDEQRAHVTFVENLYKSAQEKNEKKLNVAKPGYDGNSEDDEVEEDDKDDEDYVYDGDYETEEDDEDDERGIQKELKNLN